MKFLKNTILLSYKEIKSFLTDKVFLIFVVYAFSLDIIAAAEGVALELRNASVAYIDEDNSQLSRNFFQAMQEPYFQKPERIEFGDIKENLDDGKYIFVVVVPNNFLSDLLANKNPKVQINIDATAVSQAFIGDLHIRSIIMQETDRFLQTLPEVSVERSQIDLDQVVRIRYNANRDSRLFMAIGDMIVMITLISMILPAIALIREKEKGTIEHLMVMPLKPTQILLAKILSNGLIMIIATLCSLVVIIGMYYNIIVQGSLFLFLLGVVIFQFSAASLGVVIATFSRNSAQLALLIFLVMMPIIFLSGIFTPQESMHPIVQEIMFLSPLKHATDFFMAIVFRGASLMEIWHELAAIFIVGSVLFVMASLRFKRWFSTSSGF